MIEIVLCSHATLAQGLKEAGEMIAGPQTQLEAVCFGGDEDLMELSERIKAESHGSAEVIYVCDLLNGTPFNACALAIAGTSHLILTGASLPMLIELLIKRNVIDSAEELVESILESHGEYVSSRSARDFFG